MCLLVCRVWLSWRSIPQRTDLSFTTRSPLEPPSAPICCRCSLDLHQGLHLLLRAEGHLISTRIPILSCMLQVSRSSPGTLSATAWCGTFIYSNIPQAIRSPSGPTSLPTCWRSLDDHRGLVLLLPTLYRSLDPHQNLHLSNMRHVTSSSSGPPSSPTCFKSPDRHRDLHQLLYTTGH